jgi:hypothetical protein
MPTQFEPGGQDGREVREYDGQIVKPKDIVDDVRKALNEG